jgi:sugar (pentulose or hexulose) kinase
LTDVFKVSVISFESRNLLITLVRTQLAALTPALARLLSHRHQLPPVFPETDHLGDVRRRMISAFPGLAAKAAPLASTSGDDCERLQL